MRIILITYSVILSLAASGAVSHAGIIKYKDNNGVTHYKNIPNVPNIPDRKAGNKVRSRQNTVYDRIILNKSYKYRLDPSIIKAVITAESNWNPRAVSNKGAIGLMQLMPSTAREMRLDPYSPEENIEGGTRYLRYLLDRFNGRLDIALAAYNAGPSIVEKVGGIPSIAETRQYVRKVLSISKMRIRRESSRIYKLKLKDGSTLYTNTPSFYRPQTLPNF
jgi:soluble lytic murein transglycosylase